MGSVARYLAVISLDRKINAVFPFGTIAVNFLGSFLLGLILALLMKKTGVHLHQWKLFLGTGFCGGFTTFSAFAAENINLFEQKLPGTAIAYISASVIGGLFAVWAGFMLGRNML